MKVTKKIMEVLLTVIAIYGMFFAKLYITKETDDEYNLFGETYKMSDSKNIFLKDQLNFIDGVNNGMALFGHWIKSIFITTWDVITSLNDLIGFLPINFLWKILLYILLIFVSMFIAMLITMITLPVLIFKFLFFKATISYYVGFCLFWFFIFMLSEIIERLEKSTKYQKHSNKKTSA